MKKISLLIILCLFLVNCGRGGEEDEESEGGPDKGGSVGKLAIFPLKTTVSGKIQLQINLDVPDGKFAIEYMKDGKKIDVSEEDIDKEIKSLPLETKLTGQTKDIFDSTSVLVSEPILIPTNADPKELKERIKRDLINKRVLSFKKQLKVEWYSGETLLAAQGNTIIPIEYKIKKGNKIYAKVKDPGTGKVYKSAEVEIINSLPRVENLVVKVLQNGNLQAVADIKDDDNDPDIKVTYVWKAGDQIIEGADTDVLDYTKIPKGKEASVSVTASDGTGTCPPVNSKGSSITNIVPKITSSPGTSISNGVYTYQVTAEDPDNDPLTFSIEGAPSGMSIDAKSGLITWTIPQGVSGDFTFKVVADDGKGGKVSQTVPLVLTAGKEGTPVTTQKKEEEKKTPFGDRPDRKYGIGKDFYEGK